MQRTLDKLIAWANRWEVDLSKQVYNAFGKRKLKFQYQMNDGWVK